MKICFARVVNYDIIQHFAALLEFNMFLFFIAGAVSLDASVPLSGRDPECK